ncbi:hypothetical protein BH20VER3_BH20VER3_19220 [soil metagenome]
MTAKVAAVPAVSETIQIVPGATDPGCSFGSDLLVCQIQRTLCL